MFLQNFYGGLVLTAVLQKTCGIIGIIGRMSAIFYLNLTRLIVTSENKTCQLSARLLRKTVAFSSPFAISLVFLNILSNNLFNKPALAKNKIFCLTKPLEQISAFDLKIEKASTFLLNLYNFYGFLVLVPSVVFVISLVK